MAIIVNKETQTAPLGTVKIDGYVFDKIGYGMLQTANTVTYVENPKRSNTGAIYIKNYDTYVIPSCQIGFGLISIEQFMLLRRLLLTRKEHTVEYFDADFGTRVTHRMMVDDDKLKTFFSLGSKVIGMQNFSIKFEGTLSPWEQKTVVYDANGGSVAGGSETQIVSKKLFIGEATDVPAATAFENGSKRLICFCDKTDANGAPAEGAMTFYPEEEIIVVNDMTLYAVWGD